MGCSSPPITGEKWGCFLDFDCYNLMTAHLFLVVLVPPGYPGEPLFDKVVCERWFEGGDSGTGLKHDNNQQ